MPQSRAKKNRAVAVATAAELLLKPQADDQEIPEGTPPYDVLAKVMLFCDDNTGVYFFRHKGKLYLRLIEVPGSSA